MRESVLTKLLSDQWIWEPFWNNSYKLKKPGYTASVYVIWRLNGGFNVNTKDPSGIPHATNLTLDDAIKLAETLVITGAV